MGSIFNIIHRPQFSRLQHLFLIVNLTIKLEKQFFFTSFSHSFDNPPPHHGTQRLGIHESEKPVKRIVQE